MSIKILYNNNKIYYSYNSNSTRRDKPLELTNHALTKAYMVYGENLPKVLQGDFAFALYDSKSNFYFCARDHLGIKELYFTNVNNEYYFSNNIDHLLNISGLPKNPNLQSLHNMFNHRHISYTDTMYNNIFRIPPGHYMIIEDGTEYIKQYWFPEKINIDYNITSKEASEKIHYLLKEAILGRVTDTNETAFELSGGVDSSSIVSLLCQTTNPKHIHSYSMNFHDLTCDETQYIDAICKIYSIDHQKIPSDQNNYTIKELYDIGSNWPITMTFSMYLPMYYGLKDDKRKVIITGQGGDHLFTGSPYVLNDLIRRFKFQFIIQELKYYPKKWNTIKSFIIKPLLHN